MHSFEGLGFPVSREAVVSEARKDGTRDEKKSSVLIMCVLIHTNKHTKLLYPYIWKQHLLQAVIDVISHFERKETVFFLATINNDKVTVRTKTTQHSIMSNTLTTCQTPTSQLPYPSNIEKSIDWYRLIRDMKRDVI